MNKCVAVVEERQEETPGNAGTVLYCIVQHSAVTAACALALCSAVLYALMHRNTEEEATCARSIRHWHTNSKKKVSI